MSSGTMRHRSGRWGQLTTQSAPPSTTNSKRQRWGSTQGQGNTNLMTSWIERANTSQENTSPQVPRYGTLLPHRDSINQAQGCLDQATITLSMRWVILGNMCCLLIKGRGRGDLIRSSGPILLMSQLRSPKVYYLLCLAPGPGNYRHTSEFGHYDQISSRSQLQWSWNDAFYHNIHFL